MEPDSSLETCSGTIQFKVGRVAYRAPEEVVLKRCEHTRTSFMLPNHSLLFTHTKKVPFYQPTLCRSTPDVLLNITITLVFSGLPADPCSPGVSWFRSASEGTWAKCQIYSVIKQGEHFHTRFGWKNWTDGTWSLVMDTMKYIHAPPFSGLCAIISFIRQSFDKTMFTKFQSNPASTTASVARSWNLCVSNEALTKTKMTARVIKLKVHHGCRNALVMWFAVVTLICLSCALC